MRPLMAVCAEPTREVPGQTSRVSIDRYVDPAVLQRERALLFRKHPIIVAHVSELPAPGDFATEERANKVAASGPAGLSGAGREHSQEPRPRALRGPARTPGAMAGLHGRPVLASTRPVPSADDTASRSWSEITRSAPSAAPAVQGPLESRS